MAKQSFLVLINVFFFTFQFSCLTLSTLFCLKRVSLGNPGWWEGGRLRSGRWGVIWKVTLSIVKKDECSLPETIMTGVEKERAMRRKREYYCVKLTFLCRQWKGKGRCREGGQCNTSPLRLAALHEHKNFSYFHSEWNSLCGYIWVLPYRGSRLKHLVEVFPLFQWALLRPLTLASLWHLSLIRHLLMPVIRGTFCLHLGV